MVSQYFTASDLHKCSVHAAKRTDTHSAFVPLHPRDAAGTNGLYAVVWRLLVLECCGPAIQCI